MVFSTCFFANSVKKNKAWCTKHTWSINLPFFLKSRSHRQCDCNTIALRPQKLTIIKKSQRSQKGFIEVATRAPIGCRAKSIISSLLSMHKRLAATDLVAQRFHWSLRGCEVVLFSSQTGFRLYGDEFHLEKGGVSLQTSDDLSVTDQRWGGDRSNGASSDWLVTLSVWLMLNRPPGFFQQKKDTEPESPEIT